MVPEHIKAHGLGYDYYDVEMYFRWRHLDKSLERGTNHYAYMGWKLRYGVILRERATATGSVLTAKPMSMASTIRCWWLDAQTYNEWAQVLESCSFQLTDFYDSIVQRTPVCWLFQPFEMVPQDKEESLY